MITVIHDKNSRTGGRGKGKGIIRHFREDSINYLREYFKRNVSELGFCSIKRTTGSLHYSISDEITFHLLVRQGSLNQISSYPF